jgi:Na+/H+ antiporter NhaD/arsenite permease-like protein
MKMALAISIFLIAYGFIALEKFNRVAVAMAGAAGMVLIGASDADAAFFSHETGIDWNVIFLLLGMMIIVSVIHKTGLFEFIAVKAIKVSKGNPKKALILLAILTAVASAILDNVTTILLVVPMTLTITKYLKVSPIPFILTEVFLSNIGGAATLVGDPPNIIIASKANLSFNSFLEHMAPQAILVSAVIIPFLAYIFRKELVNTAEDRGTIANLNEFSFLTDKVLLRKAIAVLIIVVSAFVTHTITHIEPSVIALLGAGLLVLISNLKPKDWAFDIEWNTLAFFAGLFVMVGGLVNVGALQKFAEFLQNEFGDNSKVMAGIILGVSAVLSGIVDNIPYVASMAPVITELTKNVVANDPNVLWWALAFGADFGGNATIVGASANVVAIGLAAAAGYKISFWNFAKYGIPVTLISILFTYPYLFLLYF